MPWTICFLSWLRYMLLLLVKYHLWWTDDSSNHLVCDFFENGNNLPGGFLLLTVKHIAEYISKFLPYGWYDSYMSDFIANRISNVSSITL